MTDTFDVPRTLLLADGNPTTQRVVALAFADEPFSVATASDADEVSAALEKNVPDIVVADIGLEGATGYDVAESISRDRRLAHVPVLLLAGAFETVDRDRVAAAGVAGVITKPFDPQALVERVRQLLAERSTAALSDAPEPASTGPAVTEPDRDLPWVVEQLTERAQYPPVAEFAMPGGDSGLPEGPEPIPEAPEPIEERAVVQSVELDLPEQPAGESTPRSPQLDRYFDQLDEAFATLAQAPRSGPPVEPEPLASPVDQASIITAPSRGASPRIDALGDAFAVLLASEESGEPPTSLFPPQPEATIDDEPAQALDPAVRRALEQTIERVLRESVPTIVAATAERLIREEIERIKHHIK